MTQLRTTIFSLVIAGLAAGSSAEDLYAIRDGGKLSYLNMALGEETLIGHTSVQRASSLDMGPDGMLYMHSRPNSAISPARLYQVDPGNASATLISDLGYGFELEGGLTIRDDGMAYLVGGRSNGSSFESAIFLVDLSTGVSTEIGILDILDINGLTLRSDGMLVAWNQYMPGPFTIDPDTMETEILSEEVGNIFSFRPIGGMESADQEVALIIASHFVTEGNSPPAMAFSLDMYSGELKFLSEFEGDLLITGIASVDSPCPADLNMDGTINFFDVSEFLSAFAAMDLASDFNKDGTLNFFDIAAFLTVFSEGCP